MQRLLERLRPPPRRTVGSVAGALALLAPITGLTFEGEGRMLPAPALPARPGRRWARHAMGLTVLTAAGSLALPAGTAAAGQAAPQLRPALAAAPASAMMITQPVLRLGSSGPAVVQLQRRLATLHYDVGPIDGGFGSQTFHAVVAFQKVNGLVRDGIVGSRTWAALARPVIPRPRRWLSASSLEVNVTRQVVYLARQGVVLRILDASTGKASTPTPLGNFSIQRRIDGWRQSTLGLLWRPNYFYRGYAVHGSTSVPAYPASHGCVRVTIPAMNRLWPVLRIGMPVSLYR
jgi:lipoprotein-anchoring transpeptidase ErfK/SrfK